MDKEARRQALVDALKRLTPEMRETLKRRKREGKRDLERPDFVWHLLLQSFATWGGSRGWEGLMGTRENYDRVTFEALSKLDAETRVIELKEVFLAAGVRYATTKARLMARNYDLVAEMGGSEEAKRLAFAQEGREAKIAFMKRFYGVGDKYARNIWMDSYHPDFRDAIAVDERIKKVTEALGYSFRTYAEHERFYQEIAKEAGLQGWEVDRLLYNHLGEFLDAITASGEEPPTDTGEGFVWQQGDSVTRGSAEGVAKKRRFSATDLIALSGLPRALEIIEVTIDAEVREELTRLAGNKPKRAPGNLVRRIREEKGYYVYASLDTEEELGCYVGYAVGSPDGYPKLQVGLYTVAGAAESGMGRMAIERISRLEGWGLNSENAEEHEVRRETDLGSLLGEKDHVAAAKGFFTSCIRQLREELTAFKVENPDLLWSAG